MYIHSPEVTLNFDRIVMQTEKALMLKINKDYVWIPRELVIRLFKRSLIYPSFFKLKTINGIKYEI